MATEKKLIDFFERFTKLLYKDIEINPVEYEQNKNHLMKPALNLLKMVKEYVKEDSDLGVIIYLVDPPCFKAWPPEREDLKEVKRRRAFLLEYFNLKSKELYKRAKSLEGKIEKKYGEEWFAMAHFPEAY